MAEHLHGKEGVRGSNPLSGSTATRWPNRPRAGRIQERRAHLDDGSGRRPAIDVARCGERRAPPPEVEVGVAWVQTPVAKSGRKSYRAFWRDPAGKTHGKVFERRRDAEAFGRLMEQWRTVGSPAGWRSISNQTLPGGPSWTAHRSVMSCTIADPRPPSSPRSGGATTAAPIAEEACPRCRTTFETTSDPASPTRCANSSPTVADSHRSSSFRAWAEAAAVTSNDVK